jgi:glycine/D-amino acid oxidase-like deaminating enzyme
MGENGCAHWPSSGATGRKHAEAGARVGDPGQLSRMRAKILIVGGGIMGVSCALKCAQRTGDPNREPVVLLERKHLGAGSSGRSGAILRQHYRDAVVARMARDSLREYAAFETRTGLSLGFHKSGVLTLAGPGQPEWVARIRENVVMLRDLGIETELVDAARMRALVPGIQVAEGAVGAWEPGGGFVDPGRTLEAFAKLARAHGAVTRLGVALEELRVERGRVTGARTSEGDYEVDAVVLVTGPWTRALLARLGRDLPLKVVRPENHYLAVPEMGGAEERAGPARRSYSIEDLHEGGEEPRAPRGLHPVLIDLEHGFYARCDPAHARTRVGHVDYDADQELADPDTLVEEVGPEVRRWSRAVLSKRLPAYASRPDAGSIAAWYTLTPDAQALIGPVPGIAGLHVVSGFSGHGFKLGPSVGEGVAQMLFDEPVTALDPEFFAPSRFKGGEAWGGRFGL